MPAIVTTNTQNDLCNHGWLHRDRITTIDYSSSLIPDAKTRKTTSLSLTLQSAEDFFNRGIQLLNQGLFSKAAEALFSATQLQWPLVPAHIELGNAYSALKEFDKALEAYNNALENEPGSTIAHYNIALTHYDLTRHEECRQWTTAVLKLDPKHQLAYALLAKLHLAASQPREALAQLLIAAKLSKPHHPDLLTQAGMLYEQLNEPKLALRCFRRALKSNPWHAIAFYQQGLNLYNAGNLPAANLSIANAINTKPNYPEAKALLKRIKKELTPKKAKRSRQSAQSPLFQTEQ